LKKKILITGGSGYLAGSISSFLCQNKNYEVSICSSSNIESKHGEINTLRVDWNKKSSLRNICKSKDIIIHCASPDANFSKKNPEASYEFSNNILDSFLNEAIRNKVKKFIYFSSAHVYQPKLEGVLNEKSPIIPEHPYGVTKKIAEQTLLNKKELIEVNIIRLSNAFGIPSNENLNCWRLVVNDFCKQVVLNKEIIINSDGSQIRNFVSVNEVCRLIDFMINCFYKQKLLPYVFNFGGNWTLSILDLAKVIANQYEKIFDINPPIRIKKKSKIYTPKLNFDFSLITKNGFKPHDTNLADINELFSYVKNNFLNAR
jgi:UDP-glucose 4-epimerase